MEKRMPKDVIELLVKLYWNDSTRYLINGEQQEAVNNQKGVKQGASTSPILFNLLISRIIRVFKAQGLGAFIGNTYVGLLAFADDIALVCRSFEEM